MRNLYTGHAIIIEQFLGDVVLDSFNNTSMDEDNIVDQIYIKKICSNFYWDDSKFS